MNHLELTKPNPKDPKNPIKLASNKLLMAAFTGEDGEFTTEKVWARHNLDEQQDENPIPKSWISGTAPIWIVNTPAPNLNDLLDLANDLLERVLGDIEEDFTEAEDELHEALGMIWHKGPREERSALSIIAVLEERAKNCDDWVNKIPIEPFPVLEKE